MQLRCYTVIVIKVLYKILSCSPDPTSNAFQIYYSSTNINWLFKWKDPWKTKNQTWLILIDRKNIFSGFEIPWYEKYRNNTSESILSPLCLRFIVSSVDVRLDMVGTNHDKVLILCRHMPMGQFRANIFLIRLTSTYFRASEVGVLKVDYFDFFMKKIEKLVWIRC